MAIKTQQSFSGFIRGDLKLGKTSDNRPMFTAKAGQNQFEHVGQGEFRQLENEYIPIVQFGKAAARTLEQFRPGDRFVAEGYKREYNFTDDKGVEHTGEQFVVKKIGHDSAWTNYDVQRKEPAPAAEQEAVSQERSQEQPSTEVSQDAPDLEPSPAEPTHRLPTVSGSGMSRQAEPVGAGAQIQR